MPVGRIPMSAHTKVQIASVIDFDVEAGQREKNFDYLLSEIGDIALFRDRQEAVPIGFPVVIEDRDRVRKQLYEEMIYPPVHWDVSKVAPVNFTQSHDLSKRIMTLPCDGRYQISDMERVITELRSLI